MRNKFSIEIRLAPNIFAFTNHVKHFEIEKKVDEFMFY